MSPTLTAPEGGAIFDGPYRYRLWRGPESAPNGRVLFVMLNPSTADATLDDQTIRRCRYFTRREGFDRLDVVNLFGLRSRDPQALRYHDDPIGPNNDWHIRDAAAVADLIVVAWGGSIPRGLRARPYEVLDALRKIGDVWCLGHTERLAPCHPSRLPNAAPLVPYKV
jgi:hypothetical protein